MIDVHTHRLFWTVHKWAGLVACGWLFVLGVTGVLLDHPEWRWLNQTSIPASWASDQINRITPAGVMRHVAATPTAIFGASERGSWLSRDRGRTWREIDFQGLAGQPQVFGLAGAADQDFSGVVLATDDGLWALATDGGSARPLGLRGRSLTALSPGRAPGEVLAVEEHSRLLAIDLATLRTQPMQPRGPVRGLSEMVGFNTVVRDIHFGRGLLAGEASIWLNDLGGIAFAVLSLTGLAYWVIKRQGKALRIPVAARRGGLKWLFRFHAPVIGLLGAIPILYLSITALPLNHIYGFLDATKDWTLSRAHLPPAYQGRSLAGEIEGVAAWPGQPGRLSIATRLGLLESRDGGATWAVDATLPDPRAGAGARLFRVRDHVFVGLGRSNFVQGPGETGWRKLSGLPTAISGAAPLAEGWLIKNSRGFYRASSPAEPFVNAKIPFREAAPGTTLYLFVADIHTGLAIHSQFKWLNDLFAVLAILLALSGPVIWLRRRWV